MSNKVLITGASGLVGRALTDSLIQQGYKLHILSTQKSKVNTNSYPKTFHWDPMSNEIDLRSLEGIDSIINLAGAPIAQRWNKAAKSEIVNSRVKSLEILAHHIVAHNPLKLAYDPHDRVTPITKSDGGFRRLSQVSEGFLLSQVS